jgi:solute:Na+ symporter, SSS family
MTALDYIIVIVFLTGIFATGAYFRRWVGSPDDFFVAGRKITPFLLASALTVSNISIYSLIGVSGTASRYGISIIWQTWTGSMALVFAGLFVLPIMRRLKIRTVPEFLELRYNGAVRLLISFLWMFRLAFWIGVMLYAGAVAAHQITGYQSVEFWILLLAAVIVTYTAAGGMWSLVFTDSLQFLMMMVGLLLLLPLAMHSIGWWPGLVAKAPPGHLELVSQFGKYNWEFVIAILLLGIQWACLDQGLLQHAFSSQNTAVVSKGLVLSGVMTAPFALLWVIPGIASSILHPNLPQPEAAIPSLIVGLFPAGLLGVFVCGLLASTMSAIAANLSATATLFTNDIFARFLKRRSGERAILIAVRSTVVIAGVLMVVLAFQVPRLGGAVDAYLTVISITDMPLFVIAIVGGLLWRRATSAGAISGYLAGAAAGVWLKFSLGAGILTVTLGSAGAALAVCVGASLLTRRSHGEGVAAVFAATSMSAEEQHSGASSSIVPESLGGKVSLAILAFGFVLFCWGVGLAATGLAYSSLTAGVGMCVYFAGGLLRTMYR